MAQHRDRSCAPQAGVGMSVWASCSARLRAAESSRQRSCRERGRPVAAGAGSGCPQMSQAVSRAEAGCCVAVAGVSGFMRRPPQKDAQRQRGRLWACVTGSPAPPVLVDGGSASGRDLAHAIEPREPSQQGSRIRDATPAGPRPRSQSANRGSLVVSLDGADMALLDVDQTAEVCLLDARLYPPASQDSPDGFGGGACLLVFGI